MLGTCLKNIKEYIWSTYDGNRLTLFDTVSIGRISTFIKEVNLFPKI